MNNKSTSEENINAIGVWVLRFILLAGVIYLGSHDKGEAAGACTLGLIISFVLL